MPSSGGRVNIAMRGEVWCPSVEAEASPGPATATEAGLEAAGGRGWPPPPWQQQWPLLSAGSCHCVVRSPASQLLSSVLWSRNSETLQF